MSRRELFCSARTTIVLLGALAGFAVYASPSFAEPPKEADAKNKPLELVVFEKLLARHQDMTYEQLLGKLKTRNHLDKLSFDPTQAASFDDPNHRTRNCTLQDPIGTPGSIRRTEHSRD